MQQILGTVNYISEGMDLLFHMGEGKKYSDLKDSLSKKYSLPVEKSARIFELLENIEQTAQDVFLMKQEELNYYFGLASEQKDYPGRILLLWDTFCPSFIQTFTEYQDYLYSLSDEEYCEKFGYYLQGYGEQFREDSQYEKIDDPYRIITYLMEMNINKEEKWKLQEFYINRKEHLPKVLSLLSTAIEVLKKYDTQLTALAQEFHDYWTETLKDTTPDSYMIKKMHWNFEPNPAGSILVSSILAPNRTSLCADDDSHKPTCLVLGILFDDEFSFETTLSASDKDFDAYVLQVLKLLSDKSKFEILTYIRDKKAYGSELAKHLNLTTATVSHHMSALFTANLITIEKEDNKVYYRANQKAIEKVLAYCHKTLTA